MFMFKNMLSRAKLLVAVFIAIVMVAAACGSDDSDDSAGGDSATDVTASDTGDTSGETSDNNGDSGGDSDNQPPVAARPSDECTEERKGGSITMGMFSETSGLDPTVSSGSGVTGLIELATLYDTLVRLDSDGNYVPHLAESLTPNDDNTVWTLQLRPDVYFGNGDPLDAPAVIASIDRFNNLDPSVQRNQSASFVAFITEMVATDDLTVVFTLNEPWGTFPYTLADEPGMIVNVNVVNSFDSVADFSRDPTGAGAGPYELVRYVPQEEIVVRAKDDYWGGPVCIEEITFTRIPGAQATYESFQQDDLQVAFLREPKVIDEARENGDTNAFSFLQNTGGVMLVNNGVRGSEPPTADVRLRQALFLAMDADELNLRANEGTGLATKSLLDSRSRYYDESLFGEFPTDVDRARELVEEVKAEGNWDGSIRLHCHNAPSRIDWAIAAEALLENVGFEVEVINNGTIQDMIGAVLINADYDLACWGFNLSDDAPYIPVLQHTCTSRSNRTGYCDENMDAAIAQLRAASTNEEIQAALAEIWSVWQETVPSVTYETIEEYIVFKDNVKGIRPTQASGIMFHDAYLEQ